MLNFLQISQYQKSQNVQSLVILTVKEFIYFFGLNIERAIALQNSITFFDKPCMVKLRLT